ncbi:hypothetical protein ACFLRO_00570 [Bacteroidota bacterium]
MLLESRGLAHVTHDTTNAEAEVARIGELSAKREDSGLTEAEREQLHTLEQRRELRGLVAQYRAGEL